MSHPGLPDPGTFLSGESGYVAGVRATARALVADAAADALAAVTRPGSPRGRAAGARRRVLVLAIEHADRPNLLGAALRELHRSRHELAVETGPTGGRGKFENLNLLLSRHDPAGFDWLLVLDDDVALPRRFLDRFLFLAETFGLVLAQPAHRARSHAAWPHTRRRPGALARRTAHVEIGPVTLFHQTVFPALLPFPPLRYGWGLDLHWAAVARAQGWPIGVIDATPIAHRLRPVAAAYPRSAAIAEAQSLLAHRPYEPASEAGRVLATYRKLPE